MAITNPNNCEMKQRAVVFIQGFSTSIPLPDHMSTIDRVLKYYTAGWQI
jgi:hypothetical protein